MTKTEFENPIAPEAHAHIMSELENVQRDNEVKIIFAIESGSRAWGFPSPDSDYDVRFVYVHNVDWYLSIDQKRDVIELPLQGDWDINGWDLKKALGLLLKPNPVLLEWLSSPIRYIWNDDACRSLVDLSEKVTHGSACLHHYLSLGQRQWKAYVEGKKEVNLKKYFYIVRPAMALRWLRMNPTITPPMNFADLKDGIDLSLSLSAKLDELLVMKSKSKELGSASRIGEVDSFIMNEFSLALESTKLPGQNKPPPRSEADELFTRLVKND